MNTGFALLHKLLSASLSLATPANVAEPALTPACAERDLRIIALIERRADAWALAPDASGELGAAQAHFRCLAGREADARAVYDAIPRGAATFAIEQ